MKIKTITCHDVYNYGASLQAYALQHYLQSLGHEVEIIDFKPWFQQIRYNFWYVPKDSKYYGLCKKSKILHFLYCLKLYNQQSTYGRKRPFDEFKTKYLKLTERTFCDSQDLKLNPPEADIYIAGSDQIWNTEAYNGKEPAYYLDFGDDRTKRISYAASFAVNDVKECMHEFIKDRLSKFDNISVREKTGLSILKSLGIHNGTLVLDPIFLLNKTQWESFPLKKKYTEPYILIYDFLHDDTNLTNSAKQIAKNKNLKIVSINDFKKLDYADINVSNAGPIEFLELIKYADYVVSNSFHATAFSILFHRQFITYPLKSQNNSTRMRDFLESIGLLDFYNQNYNENLGIDYKKIDNHINILIANSKNFIAEYIL